MRLILRCLYLALPLYLLLTSATVRAELVCKEPVVKVGEVRSGVDVTHRFSFINAGKEPIEIQEIIPSCGCLRPTLEKRVYQPGESGSLQMEVQTLSLAAGPQSWQIRLKYQGAGAAGELCLVLVGTVIHEVRVEPTALVIVSDTAVSHSVTLTDIRPLPLAITHVEATSLHLRCRLAEASRDGKGHWARSIHVEILGDYPEGRREELLHIHTNDPLYRTLRVPITVVKRSRHRVEAAPAEVQVNASVGQPLASQRVLLSTAEDQPVRVERIDADHPALQCNWAAGPGPLTTLKIQIDHARLTAGMHKATVQVRIAEPRPDTLNIPVVIRVR